MHTEWATPLVVVPKSEGQIRICADFKVTINPYLNKEHYPLPNPKDIYASLNKEHYPLPNPKDIYASLAGGKIFCALDLSEAYLQLRDKEWQWSESHRELFEKTKDWICSDSILTLNDITKPLRLICDAAPQGVGAVLKSDLKKFVS
ncbi:RNase H-like domain found in reverse transcriptase [Popillia japonica]|uniref:RNase H-like domain found in reverse transcriptase n=1 Tax=Popillia japonica TaxID=7064 RepID=A0AAW1I932_POPJA